MAIRPNYYKDENRHDMFWKMEHGMYPLEWSIGLCHINADKYERKAQTYREEEEQLKQLHREGVI